MMTRGEKIFFGALYLLTASALGLVGYAGFGVHTITGIILVALPACLIVWYVGVIIYIELDEQKYKLTHKKRKNWKELTK